MKTPPPPLRRGHGQKPNEKNEKAIHQLTGLQKAVRVVKERAGEIQTRPDWFDKVKNYRFGEIQTKPDWMKNMRKDGSIQTNGNQVKWLRIIPVEKQSYEAEKVPSKLTSAVQFAYWRFACNNEGRIEIYAGSPPERFTELKKAIRQRYPNADLQDIQDLGQEYSHTQFVNRIGALGGELNTRAKLESILDSLENGSSVEIAFESRQDHEFKAPIRNRLNQRQNSGRSVTKESIWNPFAGSTTSHNRKDKSTKANESAEDRENRRLLEAALQDNTNYFKVTIRIQTQSQKHLQSIFNELANQLRDSHRIQLASTKKQRLWKDSEGAESLWRESELETLIQIPDMGHHVAARIPKLKIGQRTLADDEMTVGVAVGRLIHPVKPSRLVKIPTSQFLQHYFLGGKNGSGKSSTEVQMTQSMIDDWLIDPSKAPGFTYLDPAGSTLMIILNRLLYAESQGFHVPWEKVHYFKIADSDYPMGLNLLHKNEGEENNGVAANVLALIHTAYGGDTVFTDRLIENGIMTLLDHVRPHTILGLISVLQYPALREMIDISDPLVQEFWDTTGDDLKAKSLDPLLNRLRPLLQSKEMRRIFGQFHWTPKILKWMDEGHIVLIDLLGVTEKNITIIGGQLVTQYYSICKTRLPDISKPHMLKIDEAHLVKIPILEKVISEARKFGLSLGLITQYPEQFDGLLLKSITENMGTFLSCTIGPSSASQMTKMMNSAFDTSTLQGLPRRQVAVYTTIDDHPYSFMVKSDPPVMYLPNGKAADYQDKGVGGEMWKAQQWAKEKALELQQRDGLHKDEVDRQIEAYMDYLRQFRPTEDDEPRLSKRKMYQPTEAEQPILEALVQFTRGQRDWRGRTSALLTQLGDYASEDELGDWTPNLLGALLNRATTWLQAKGIDAESNRARTGTEWYISSS